MNIFVPTVKTYTMSGFQFIHVIVFKTKEAAP